MSIHVSYLVERGVKGLLPVCLFAFLPFDVNAQDVIVNPDISYAGTPRQCEIGGITVKGVEGYLQGSHHCRLAGRVQGLSLHPSGYSPACQHHQLLWLEEV